jgi:hypothetical protein
MEKNKFCLAPRGYGPTSFRLTEALYFDCVPIYIWNFIKLIPFEKDIEWDKCCILIDGSKEYDIEKIVRENENKYPEMIEYGKKVFKEYLSNDLWPRKIFESLKSE